MNYAEIKYSDIANGEGVRTSLFVSGCRRGCPGCFNSGAWSFAAGEPFTREVEDEIIASLDHPFCDGLTVLGGEPMEPENQCGLVDFLERVRERFPRGEGAPGAAAGTSSVAAKTIWCFTGDTLDELMPGGRHHTEVTDRLLACVDILVDGSVGARALRYLAALSRFIEPAGYRYECHACRGCPPRLLACRCRLPVAGRAGVCHAFHVNPPLGTGVIGWWKSSASQ